MAQSKKIKITAPLISAVFSIMAFIVCIILVVFHIRFAKKTDVAFIALNNDIEATRVELENARNSLEQSIESFSHSVSEDFVKVNERIRVSDRNVTMLSKNTQAQFDETKKMSSTYDALLAEEKNRRIETVSLDNSIVIKTQEADTLFSNEKYTKAYELYTEILEFQKDNLDVRFKRVVSLFNINRLDSAVYAEILRECSVLRQNGFVDERLDEMETFINAEVYGGQRAD